MFNRSEAKERKDEVNPVFLIQWRANGSIISPKQFAYCFLTLIYPRKLKSLFFFFTASHIYI